MKALLLAVTLFPMLLYAQGDPARPWSDHNDIPADWFCVPARDQQHVRTDAHACACRGMNMEDPAEHCKKEPTYDDEGNQDGEALRESDKCKVYCKKDNCRCRLRCETT